LRKAVAQSMSPPVIAVIAGVLFGIFPPSKALLWPVETAPLGSIVKGMVRLGGAALPISMLLLGISISKGPDWKVVDVRTNITILITKMIIMPIIVVASFYIMSIVIGPQWRFLDKSTPWHVPIFLAALCVAGMPTGNTMVMLVELGGGERASMSAIIFLQYVASPIILTVSLAAFIIAITSEAV